MLVFLCSFNVHGPKKEGVAGDQLSDEMMLDQDSRIR